jgi:hypothetical protein
MMRGAAGDHGDLADIAEREGQLGQVDAAVAGLISACNVSPITAGCSKISFCMKWR